MRLADGSQPLFAVPRGVKSIFQTIARVVVFIAVLTAFGSSAFAASATPTTTTLTITAGGSSAATISPGTVVTLTAAVTSAGGSVTAGQVLFCDALAASCRDIHVLGTAQLTSAGSAIVRFIPGMGAHSYKAVYVGTNTSATSASAAAPLTVTVSQTPTSTSLTSNESAAPYTLRTTVTGTGPLVAPTGTVSFLDTTNANYVLGTAALTITSSIFNQTNPANPALPGSSSSSVVGDFNGDGIPDAAFAVRSGTYGVAIQLGLGDGTFTAANTVALQLNPTGMVVGDFNEDGKQDIAVASSSVVTILLGQGDGSFTTHLFQFSGSASFNLSVADFNHDGHQDLAIANQSEHTVSILLGHGDGTFTATAVSPNVLPYARETAVGDFNGDGNPDIAVSTGGSGSGLSILLGNGDGTFTTGTTPQTGPVPLSVAVADFNGDGKDDIAVVDDGNFLITILLSKGDGTFTPVATGPVGGVPVALTIGDFNGDGKADLAVANETANSVTMAIGNGDGSFTLTTYSLPAGTTPFGISAGDLNGDGLADVVVANNGSSKASILLSSPRRSIQTGLPGVTITGTGNHQIQASYPGDATYLPSVSSLLSLAAQPVATRLTVSANPASSVFGQQVVLTATLAPYVSQGQTTDGETVTFFNGSVNLGTGTLQSGVATLNVTSLPVGSDQISASFAGDSNFTLSASATIPYSVINATTLTLSANPTSSTYGSPITLTATLSPFTSSGKSTDAEQISFYAGSSFVGSATLAGGVATYSKATSLQAGPVSFTARYAGDSSFATATSTAVAYTVNKATPSITWSPPASATYTGRAFSSLLTASSTTPGNIAYTVTLSGGSQSPLLATTILSVGTYTLTATLTPTDTTDYTTATATSSFSVNPATLTLVPVNVTRAYGDANPVLPASLTGGLNGDQFTVTGTTTATATSPVGSYPITYTATGSNLANYTYTPQTATLTVTQATPTLTWTAPAALQYGTALSSAQLNATASVPGSITYSQTVGTILSAGTYTLTASFVPADAIDYKPSAASVSITVTKAPLTLVPVNATRAYGDANPVLTANVTGGLNGDQFTATGASTATATSPVGSYPITYTVTGSNLANYTYAPQTATLTVTQATSTLTWTTPAPLQYGTALSSAQLNAVASVPGTVTYSQPAGTLLSAGNDIVSASFTPADAIDYKPSTASVSIQVTKAPLTLVPVNATRAYGDANPVLTASLTGGLNGDQFTVTGTTTATATSPVGSYPITYTAAGSNLSNYTYAPQTATLTVTQATPTLTWTAPAALQYGTPLSSAQLNATASAPGTITYSQTAGTVLSAGTYTLSASFVPADPTDYKTSTATVAVTVTKAPLSLSANNINRTFGSANPVFSGAVMGAVNGDTFTETFTTTATPGSIVGAYPIVPAVSGSSLANYALTVTNGVLTVSQGGTATTFALSNSNLTLTATVVSLSSGAPTGSVGFYVGQTLAGTGTLVNGVASFTMASFPAGNITLTAQYSGDANFTQSSSPAIIILAVTPAATSLTVSPAGTVTDSIGLAVAPGYVGTVQFSCTGLPKGAVCSFSPSSQAFTGSGNIANVTLSVQTGTAVAGLIQRWPGIDFAVLLGLPGLITASFYRNRNRKGRPILGSLLSLLFLCGLGIGAIGCAGPSSTTSTTPPVSQTPVGTSTFQVLATGSGGLSQTTTVTLNVQ